MNRQIKNEEVKCSEKKHRLHIKVKRVRVFFSSQKKLSNVKMTTAF
jgi:hypothetical protein